MKTMQNYHSFSAHKFTSLDPIENGFDADSYSRMKFGSDQDAKAMGYTLADRFFVQHSEILMANRCVVIPSPYNFVMNAATLMTHHFIDRLNEHIVNANGEHVEFSIIHRKVSYTNDYGFLSKEKRKGLIDNDTFFVNRGFLKGKLLIFIDDVKITGTHEEKLREVLHEQRIKNDAMFLYFAEYLGDQPDIEAKLNFSAISGLDDYVELMNDPENHVIIRPIKYLLSRNSHDLEKAMGRLPKKVLQKIYSGCLAEGYYKIPQYQANFAVINNAVKAA